MDLFHHATSSLRWFPLLLLSSNLAAQQAKSPESPLKNTSYVNDAGEKALRLEVVVELDMATAWQLFTSDAGLRKWMAPVAHIDLRTGGSIVTNYDKTKTLTDSSCIHLPIINFIPQELMTLKVNLNKNFKEQVRTSDQRLQEIIQFEKLDAHHTRLISTMVGFGRSPEWDEVYAFFERGNTWTYEELLKNYR